MGHFARVYALMNLCANETAQTLFEWCAAHRKA